MKAVEFSTACSTHGSQDVKKLGKKNEYLKKNRPEVISWEPVYLKWLVVNGNGNVKLG